MNIDPSNESGKESFVSPIALPRLPPSRLYYIFQQPIATSKEDVKDKEKCDEIYSSVKSSVESGIQLLLQKREEDPYKDFSARVVYEASRGPENPAPFFSIGEL